MDDAAATVVRVGQPARSPDGGTASFLAVVTAHGFARRRADGVYTVPIGLLGQ